MIDREVFLTALHKSSGYCGHCGKKTCAGKASHSILPDKVRLSDVLNALNAAAPQMDAQTTGTTYRLMLL